MARYGQVFRGVEEKYGQDIAKLLGVKRGAVTFQVGDAGKAAAVTQGNVITLDKSWAQGTTKQDVRGALVHELAHAYQNIPGSKVPGKWVEGMADYARAELTHTAGWHPSAQVRALQRVGEDRARRFAALAAQGDYKKELLMGQPNGPRAGRGNTRLRTAGTNQRSKTGAYAPPLPPGQAYGYANQIAGLQQTYGGVLSGIRAESAAAKAQKLAAMGQIRADRIAGAAAAEGEMSQRGIQPGSSVALEAQGENIATAASAKVQVKADTSAALAALRARKMEAQGNYMTGVAGVQADKAAAQAELANQRYMEDLIATQGDSYKSLYKDALSKILAAKGRDPNGHAGSQQTKPSSYPGSQEDWDKLGRDEKFRYNIGSTGSLGLGAQSGIWGGVPGVSMADIRRYR